MKNPFTNSYSFSMMAVILASITFIGSCKDKEDPPKKAENKNTIPEFYKAAPEDQYGKSNPSYFIIADGNDNVIIPQDLDFNPTRKGELWVLNRGSENTGGSTLTITNVGKADQNIDFRRDGNARHFMALPTAISFSNNGNWGTSAGVRDANYNNGIFTGPTLWSSNMGIYARPSGGNGSHIDMLHSSPFSMGIENERENIFWVFDGFNGHVVRYDFVHDHGPGNDDHSDGKVWRYTEVEVKKDDLVPSHLVLDADKKWLYVVDNGNKRVLKMDISSGGVLRNLNLINEQLAEHFEMTGVDWKVVINSDRGLTLPCGIEIVENRLFVSDYETGDIICYNATSGDEIARLSTGQKGIMGLKVGPDGKLYYVNAVKNEVVRIEPQ